MNHWADRLQWVLIGGNIMMVCAIALICVNIGMRERETMARQDSNASGLHFSLNAGNVEVYLDGTPQPIQTIPFNSKSLTDLNRDSFIQTPDINFDGYPDLLLIRSQGAQNVYYDGWIWDMAQGQFVYDPVIEQLVSPTFDEKEKVIRTFEHGSATDHETGVYKYQNGQLVQIEKIIQELNNKTDLFDISTYRRNDHGELALVKKVSLTLEELENQNE